MKTLFQNVTAVLMDEARTILPGAFVAVDEWAVYRMTDPESGEGGEEGDEPTTPDDENLPGKTGDDFALVGLIVLMVVGMAGAAAAVVLLKKNGAR